MKNGVPQHPEAHTMAAFVDGTLAPSEVAQVAAHLRECSDCRTVVAETARFEREESRPRLQWIAIAASIVVVVALVPFLLRSRSPMHQLIAASPRDHRTVDARLSGFAWARIAAPARGTQAPDPADLKLAGAAGDVLEKSKDPHAIGVAYLLIQQRSDAIAALQRAAEHSNDAQVWNDLAAARYAFAMRDDHPAQLPEALADVDHALRIEPKSTEALFNRALIIEAIGLREQARKAWQQYLDVDSGSGWAVEAREHLQKLEQHSRSFDRKLLDTLPPDQLVREFPEDARRWSETVLLKEWADAPSDAKLDRIRAIGVAMRNLNGEGLLEDAVSSIDRATAEQRTALVAAHKRYYDARASYGKRHAAEAEVQLRDAVALFTRGGSPMASVAAFYAAEAALDQNRVGEAGDTLRSLRARIDRNRYRALAAHIGSELALAAIIQGDWATAVREADASAAAFGHLGERANAAAADIMAAYGLELVGETSPAWRRRLRALQQLDAETYRDRRVAILYSAASVLRSLQRDPAADALLDLQIEEGRNGNAVLLALAYADRERLQDARDAARRITDTAIRETTNAQIDLASEKPSVQTNPRIALASISRVIAFLQQHQLAALLPAAYLQRGRVARAASDDRSAASDYAAALQEIERQRDTIHDATLRATFLDTAAAIIDEDVDLRMATGDVAGAFATADRAKGNGTAPAIASGTCVIEYSVLPHSVTIFCLTNRGLTAQRVAIDRSALDDRVTSFVEGIHRRAAEDTLRRDASDLYALLIAPIEANIDTADEIVFVPDRILNALPFAALYDARRNRFLIERYTLRFAPSAAPAESIAVATTSPALVVADPATAKLPRLFASRDEATQIAAMHNATLLMGDKATRNRFLAAAPLASLIHYSGHADSEAGDSYSALMLAPEGDDDGVLSASDIARLQLTRHPIVILAACGTSRGDTTHVAGMSTLSRAFLTAGARAVVGTLWEIDDDVAATFFRQFHERLRSGAPPARALRDAQIEMLRSSDERLRQPATWAPIQLLSNV